MKKIILSIPVSGIGISIADQQADNLNARRMAWSKAYLEKQGFSTPDGEVKIVPEKQISGYANKKQERMRLWANRTLTSLILLNGLMMLFLRN